MDLWKSILAAASFALLSVGANAGEIWEFGDLKSIEYREGGDTILIGTLINGTPVPWQPMPREPARCTKLYETMQEHPGVYVYGSMWNGISAILFIVTSQAADCIASPTPRRPR